MGNPAEVVIFGADGRPISTHYSREAARFRGTLNDWRPRRITSRASEVEKQTVAARAWDLYNNTPMGRGILNGARVDVVGTGLTPLPSIRPERLYIEEDDALAIKQALVDKFAAWAFDPRTFCDRQRRQTYYRLQAWHFLSWKITGIGISQVRFMPMDGVRPASLAILPIASERLRTPLAKQSANIYDGIEVDSAGMPVAVWITDAADLTGTRSQRYGLWNKETGLPEFLLVTGVDNIAEYRQGTMLDPVVKAIRDAEDLFDSAVVGAALAQSFAVYLQSPSSQGGIAALGGGNPLAQNSNGGGAYDWENAVYNLPRGMMMVGQPGYEPKSIDTTKPGPNYEAHFAGIREHIGTGTQRGAESLTRKYDASFSASQASLLNAEKFAQDDRAVLIDRFCLPVWSWLAFELAKTGKLPLPPGIDPVRDLPLYAEVDHLPPPFKSVLPSQAATANKIMFETGEKALSEAFAEKGVDPDVAFRRLARDKKKLLDLQIEMGVDLGVRPWSENQGASNA